MDCRDCPRFCPDAQRCLDGKINPARWEAVQQAATQMGLRAICPLNDHRERLVASYAKVQLAGVRPRRVEGSR